MLISGDGGDKGKVESLIGDGGEGATCAVVGSFDAGTKRVLYASSSTSCIVQRFLICSQM